MIKIESKARSHYTIATEIHLLHLVSCMGFGVVVENAPCEYLL